MALQKRRHNYSLLGVLVLLAVFYTITIYFWRPLSNAHKVEGILGILLGLYICSKPAANLLDLLFDLLSKHLEPASGLRLVLWLVVNLALLLVGWFVITLGATRFTAI